METAKKAGARGGTVLRARLSAVGELDGSYGLNMTPKKELLMIIVPNGIRNAVMESVNQAMACAVKRKPSSAPWALTGLLGYKVS